MRWHNSRVCVWYFQVCKFQFCLLAKYFISVDNCSCSQINFGQTAVEEILILCCVLVSPLELASAPASQGQRCWRQLTRTHMDEPRLDLVLHQSDSRWRSFSYLAMLQMAQHQFRNAAGPCMDFSVHAPNNYLTVVFN